MCALTSTAFIANKKKSHTHLMDMIIDRNDVIESVLNLANTVGVR